MDTEDTSGGDQKLLGLLHYGAETPLVGGEGEVEAQSWSNERQDFPRDFPTPAAPSLGLATAKETKNAS